MPPTDFCFVIMDMFALKAGGVVIAGQVTTGVLHAGDHAVCIPESGKPFPCVIQSIEQPDPAQPEQSLHLMEAHADGPFSGLYALRIPGREKSDFHPGDRLFPIGTASPERINKNYDQYNHENK